MLSHYDSPASSGDPQRDELTRRIFLEIQRRLPGLLNRKITNYISSRNTVNDVVENVVVNDVYEDRYQDDYSQERQESEDFYENYDYNTYVPVVASTTSTTTTTTTTPATTTTTKPPRSTVRTILTFNTAALPRLRRPQPTPFHQIPKSLETGHYTYSHQYTSQVSPNQKEIFYDTVPSTSISITIIIPCSYWAVQRMFRVPCASYWTIRCSWLKLFEESHKDLRRMIVLSNRLLRSQTLRLMRTAESPLLPVRGLWPPLPGQPPAQLTPSHRTPRTAWVLFYFVSIFSSFFIALKTTLKLFSYRDDGMFQERGLSLETAPEGNIFCVN